MNLRSKLTTQCLMTAAITLAAGLASAAPQFKVTEAYTGVSGSDGTPDWFELTNLGDVTGSTAGLFYDDDSADPTKNSALPGFNVASGEAVIILIDADASDVVTFRNFWGSNVASTQVGFLSGGKLGSGSDAVNVFLGNTSGAPLVDSLVYSTGGGLNGTLEDITGDGPITNSVLGVNGAFNSIGSTGIGTLIGSPGVVIPEPATLALLGLGGLMIAGRRRKA